MSSDSESALDEVVITSSSYDSHHYDTLNSPIHFCDNSIQSDDNSSGTITSSIPSSSVRAYEEAELSISSANNSSISPSLLTTTTTTAAVATTTTTTTTNINNQLTTDICNYKNSKSRRLEYSLRCLKYSGRSNPSQDSAFGSLTDGELSIASSSFRLSSFQSMTSPIDEGVEDIIISTTTATTTATDTISDATIILSSNNESNKSTLDLMNQQKTSIQIDSAISTPCRDGSPNFCLNDDELRRSHFSLSLSPKRQYSETTSPNHHHFQFDPPKILVNDQNSIYTTSPSKKSGTIEVFSQKYRVSSFEDMSPRKKNNLRNVKKTAFRSLEEERRIDSAFIPIKNRTNSENRVYNINNTEKYKKLTHTSFSHRINSFNNVNGVGGVGGGSNGSGSSGGSGGNGNNSNNGGGLRDRHSMWKDSIFYRKIKIAKSNDSLLDSPLNTRLSPSPPSSASYTSKDNNYELKNNTLNRGNSINELPSSSSLSSNLQQQHHQRHHFGFTKKRGHSEDLTTIKQTSNSDVINFLQIDSNRKSRSERYLFNLSKLKQTAINDYCYNSDNDENLLFNNDNNKIFISSSSSSQCSINQISSNPNLKINSNTNFKSNQKISNLQKMKIKNEIIATTDNNDDSSEESLPLHQDVCKIIGGMDDIISNNEEKTPLLDSMEMSPIISPTDPDPPGL